MQEDTNVGAKTGFETAGVNKIMSVCEDVVMRAGVEVGVSAGAQVRLMNCYAGVGGHKCIGRKSSGDTVWEH